MKDPLAFGTAASAGAMVVLALWKQPLPRWIAIMALIIGLTWAAIADPMPPDVNAGVEDESPRLTH
jgi:hypothetical protein